LAANTLVGIIAIALAGIVLATPAFGGFGMADLTTGS